MTADKRHLPKNDAEDSVRYSIQVGQKVNRAFSADVLRFFDSWGVAPGQDEKASLALNRFQALFTESV
jgi:hypothetical protein